MKLIKINGEKGYDKLSHLPFNRNFKLRQSLVESIKVYGFIQPIITIKTNIVDGCIKTYILDGQHRAMAAQYLDIPFYAYELSNKVKSTTELVELVAKLNNSAVAWKIEDYAVAYASLDIQDYKELLQVNSKYGYTLPVIANMLEGSINTKKSNDTVKLGTFAIKAMDVTIETLNLGRKTKRMNTRMLMAFHKLRLTNDNFEFNKFKKNFEESYEMLKNESYDDYYNVFLKLI